MELNGATYTMDEERAEFCRAYTDDVRMRAMGGVLLVEQRVDLSAWLGDGQGGTSDAIIVLPEKRKLIIEDLKYGQGEQVFAYRNAQMMCYALGALEIASVYCDEIETIEMVVCQPRLYHIDSWECSVAELLEFGERAKQSVADSRAAIESTSHVITWSDADYELLEPYCDPADKTCRWCQAKPVCTKLARKVVEEVGREFENVEVTPPEVPRDSARLSTAMNAVPLITQWCKAVAAEVNRRVREGEEVIGADGKPYKIVEGKKGKRVWKDELLAEAELMQHLTPDKMYKPAPIITVAQAAKLLDKKATKQLWKDKFAPLASQEPGKPLIVLGSDPRPPYAGVATADEFEELGESNE